MKTIRRVALALALLAGVPALVQATPSQVMPDAAKSGFQYGRFIATHTYKMILITSSATTPATTLTQYSATNGYTNCTASGVPWACCSGSNAGTCTLINNEVASGGGYTTGGASLTANSPPLSVSSDHSCIGFSSPITWTTSTITARAACVIDTTTTGGDVVGCYCLDGGSCAADTSSTGGTFTVTLPAGLWCIN